jgi:hypothetical protein
VVFGVTFGVALGVMFGGFGVWVGVALGVALGVAFWLTFFRMLSYPLDAALSARAYFAARRAPQAALLAWRWCPVAWNEVIWLPLPYVARLLALLTQQDHQEGLSQIAFVAAERPRQRRAALSALTEVAAQDLQANSLSEMANVTERLNWTTDAPVELPAELQSALPRFDRAAQEVGQYLALASSYRKGEALERAVTEVKALQNSLIAARGRYASSLQRIANKWERLLTVEQQTVRAQLEAAKEIPNPFVFGPPVRETEQNLFTGRQNLANQIAESILGAAQAPTLLLYGPRRMGKSSLLNQLPRLLGPDFAPAVVDCQNPALTESREALLRYLSRALSAGLRRRRVSVEPLTAAVLEREPFGVFDTWLDGVEKAMPETMRALLCLDEYERLQATLDAGWGAAFLDTLRHTLQHRPRIVLMFTGARSFAELGPAWTDRFISARRVRVSFLTPDEVRPLLTKPIPEFDMTYADGTLEQIIAATHCQPFLTQAVAFELVQYLNQQRRKEAEIEDVEEAVSRALVSGDAYFANVWFDAGEPGQAILRTLACGETPPDFPAARNWLQEHDVLHPDGTYKVPMMQRWVCERSTNVTTA